jgi:hypothetical protein
MIWVAKLGDIAGKAERVSWFYMVIDVDLSWCFTCYDAVFCPADYRSFRQFQVVVPAPPSPSFSGQAGQISNTVNFNASQSRDLLVNEEVPALVA